MNDLRLESFLPDRNTLISYLYIDCVVAGCERGNEVLYSFPISCKRDIKGSGDRRLPFAKGIISSH